MTFWQDARPATPRLRRPSASRPRRWRRSWWIAVVGVAAAVVAVPMCRGTTGASERPLRPDRRATEPRIVAARWSRALPDEPQALLADGPDVVVPGRDTVSAFRARDGRRTWQVHVPGVRSPAALDRTTVLVAADSGFTALDRATGRVRWHTTTAEPPGPVALLSPTSAPGLAVVGTEPGGLAGLDLETGSPRWSVRLRGRMRGRPAVDPVSGSLAAVWEGGGTTQLRVIDAATGAIRWVTDLAAGAGSPAIAPADEGRLVVVGAGDGQYTSAVRAFGLDDGRERWHTRVDASFQPDLAPVVDGAAVDVLDQLGTLSRLDLDTGRRRWRTPTGRAAIDARPIRVADALLLPSDAGEVFALDAATGRMRARRLSAGFPVGLVAVRGRVVLAQRLVPGHGLQGFRAARLATAGRSE